jgi:predicted SAM-dependent methyltransferase
MQIKSDEEIKIELGAGAVKGQNGWLTLDLSDVCDIYWDLSQPLPFPDGSVSRLYSSHVLEHFSYKDLVRLLSDCYRVLKPGGILDACVPDASIYVRAYVNPEGFDCNFLIYKPAVFSDLKIDWLNYIAYMDGHHRYMFDQENLIRILVEAGFTDAQKRDFDASRDKLERKYESIYAFGSKPKERRFGEVA